MQSKIRQFKYGADATVQLAEWIGLMVRGDLVNYDLDHGGYTFLGLTGRLRPATAAGALCATLAFAAFARLTWKLSIRRYTSASS